MTKDFAAAINQIAEEKNIDKKIIIETIEAALAAAFRKDYGKPEQNIKVDFNEETGAIKVYDEKNVVKKFDEEMEEDHPEKVKREFILLKDAKKIKKDAKDGDVIKTDITPKDGGRYGRIAAQTAKQVIIQRIREAERDSVFSEFKDKEKQSINATVQRIEGNNVFIDLGTTNGIMYPQDQIRGENYKIGQRYKVYVSEVRKGAKGPEIIVSRTSPELVKKLFELEVPEVYAKTVEIKSIAREPGSRTKIAVYTEQEGVDPVGSCVGQRGTRVQTVITELGGEKIDIIEWNEDIGKFISNALSPAKVVNIKTDENNKQAIVEVQEDQLSLAIGKSGQNVRLAAKLAGWKIDIKKAGGDAKKGKEVEAISDDAKKNKGTGKDKKKNSKEEKEKKSEDKKSDKGKDQKDEKSKKKKEAKEDEKSKEQGRQGEQKKKDAKEDKVSAKKDEKSSGGKLEKSEMEKEKPNKEK